MKIDIGGEEVEAELGFETLVTYEEEFGRDLIQDFHVLWPIPQAVRDANTGEFPQNPGYEGYEG